jgi:hypothetical protein
MRGRLSASLKHGVLEECLPSVADQTRATTFLVPRQRAAPGLWQRETSPGRPLANPIFAALMSKEREMLDSEIPKPQKSFQLSWVYGIFRDFLCDGPRSCAQRR